jgi:hypothetical protein
MTITEFLEARIEEDERHASSGWSSLRDTRWDTDDYGRDMLTPSAVLAECAAKRELVEIHTTCDDVSYGDASTCPEIRTLAAVYKDHPDYQQEWARG